MENTEDLFQLSPPCDSPELPSPPAEEDIPPVPTVPEVEDPFLYNEKGLSCFGFSQRGESHIRSETNCQDRCAFRAVADTGIVVAAIADGVGSCVLSDVGAYTAVWQAVDSLADALDRAEKDDKGDPVLTDAWMGSILRATMQKACDSVEKVADESGQLLYSFQSTLTIAVYDGETLYFAHAGDDGIVTVTGAGMMDMVTTRHKGEEYSSVYPLQNKPTWQFGKVPDTVAFFMCTDGVLDAFVGGERENNRIYYPFLEPLIMSSQATPEETKALCRQYYDIMGGEGYRLKVSDDLTLVSVVNTARLDRDKAPVFRREVWDADTARFREERRSRLYPGKEQPQTPAETASQTPPAPPPAAEKEVQEEVREKEPEPQPTPEPTPPSPPRQKVIQEDMAYAPRAIPDSSPQEDRTVLPPPARATIQNTGPRRRFDWRVIVDRYPAVVIGAMTALYILALVVFVWLVLR